MCDLSVERNSLDGAEPLPRVITRRGEETMEDHADIMPLSSYDEDLQHKTILVGDSSVGKTSLLVQFDQGKFLPGSFTSTVGIGFTNKMVTVDGMNVKLQIWDTAGQERFRSVTHAYYRDAQALLLLYDITSKTSFDNIRCDVNSGRVIRTEDGETLAKEYGIPFMETSAKTGVNVELAFMAVAKELKQRSSSPDDRKFQIHQYIESQKKKSGCCRLL
ncbi:ras-related protein Rab-37 isoform X7 [Dendrobates tinctorius]|uniref:ras-related protein Rab-37 isoform X7 n=1 Tax=Dendrobates tinctorius TaxID=92724 RepID=UPI003CCA415B